MLKETAVAVGIGMLTLSIPVSANHEPLDIPKQGDPALDTPIKRVPRPIIGALREPLSKLPQIENFKVIGHDVIPNPGDTRPRGRNGGIAIQDDCLYVANRLGRRTGTGAHFGTPELPPEIAIVDISNPARPRTVGHFATILGSNNREIHTIEGGHALFVLNDGAVDNIQIYDVSNCRRPVLANTIEIRDSGHEFFLWRDPANMHRFLVYVSHSGTEPGLRVYEVMDPPHGTVNSVPVATFTLTPAVPRNEPTDSARYRDDHFRFQNKPTSQTNSLHSMAVSEDGTRVYMANSQAGYFILDSTLLAQRAACNPNTVTVDENTNKDPTLCLRKINPDPGARNDHTPPFRGIHHSIYPVPGRNAPQSGKPQYAVTGGESNGTVTCPWTVGEILDVTDEMNPTTIARYMVPENLGENCFLGGPGDPALLREFSTHQPLIFPNLFFLTWYSAGFRAWDISNASLPSETGVFVPKPEKNVVEYFRDSKDVWMWPFPILHNGLIYVTDENSGLYVLQYRGPRANELPRTGTFVSNNAFQAGKLAEPRPRGGDDD